MFALWQNYHNHDRVDPDDYGREVRFFPPWLLSGFCLVGYRVNQVH